MRELAFLPILKLIARNQMDVFQKIVRPLLRLRNRHFFAFDLLVLTLSPLVALELRTDGAAVWSEYGVSIIAVIVTFLIIKLSIFFPSGLYHRYWRYASVDELMKITLACFGSMVVATAVFMLVLRPLGVVQSGFPRSIPLIDGMITLIGVGGGRYLIRIAQRAQQRLQGTEGAVRVLIVGAGDAGLMIAGEMQSNSHLRLVPLGFVDDDPSKQRMRIRGMDVLGTREDIPRLSRKHNIKMVVIAMPTAPGKEIREIVRICKLTGVKTQVIPGFHELLDGVSVSSLRDVQVEDLLRRPPVRTDTARVADMVRGKRIMVTGSGGSIGSELCRQLLRLEPSELILLGHGETSIFLVASELNQYLASHYANVMVRTVLADIRDGNRMKQVFKDCKPEIIYHAAAHKHVSLMEENVAEAITNNVGGTRTLLSLAHRYGVERFVMISTDKAVNPSSIMGATKRIAELVVGDFARRTGKAFIAVRFGNVLGSRGSVVHIFRKQIEQGGPVTVSDLEAERYFMTIPEAVQLVLQAGALGSGGEVFVLDMGDPVKIIDLARDLIRLSGKEEGRDVDILVTGLRSGEKMTERLFRDEEHIERTLHEKILVTRNGHSERMFTGFALKIDELLEVARSGSIDEVKSLITTIVPESMITNMADSEEELILEESHD